MMLLSAIHTQFSFCLMSLPRDTGASSVYPIASDSRRMAAHSVRLSSPRSRKAPGTFGMSTLSTLPSLESSNPMTPGSAVNTGRSRRKLPDSRVSTLKCCPCVKESAWVGEWWRFLGAEEG